MSLGRGQVRMTFKLDPISKIKLKRNLEKDGKAQRFLTHEIRRLSDPYVPMDTGTLKNTAVEDVDSITYIQPYAAVQWYNNKGNGLRGKMWCIRMWQDRGREIVKSVANYVGGRVG